MQECPILERKNIPIASLLRTPSIRKEIHSICQNQCVDDTFLTSASVTFRQLFLLSSKERIPGGTMELIFEFLASEDRSHPVFLEEEYAYLKEPAWCLNMSEISYMKVSLEKRGEYVFSIHKIQKEINPVSGKPYLILFPEDSGKANGCSEDRERMGEERNVTFDHEYQMQEFMKEIILNGVVDLEDYS